MTIIQEDPREAAGEDAASTDDENPVLSGLKKLAESVGKSATGR